MGKLDKYFGGVTSKLRYNYQNKEENVNNYVNYMVNRSLAMFKWHNLPDSIPQEELEKILQCGGIATWYKHDGELYVFNAALGGEEDVYNRPTKAVITSPALKLSVEAEINKDCVVMLNDSLAMGLLPLYEKYCYIINETDITMILATVNKRIQILLSANDDNTVQSAKRFISDIEQGKLGVIAETKLFDSLKVNNSSTNNNQSLKDIYELQMYLKASLYNEIGLGAVQNNKKERLAVAEIESNSDNLYPLVDDMLTSRRKAIEKVNEMFGTDIQVEFNSSWDYRVYQGESIDTIEKTGESDIPDGEMMEQTSIDTSMEQEEPTDGTNTEQEEPEETVVENVETPEDGGTSKQSNDKSEIEEPDKEHEEPTTEQEEEKEEPVTEQEEAKEPDTEQEETDEKKKEREEDES